LGAITVCASCAEAKGAIAQKAIQEIASADATFVDFIALPPSVFS
jgi:hypothetical protein